MTYVIDYSLNSCVPGNYTSYVAELDCVNTVNWVLITLAQGQAVDGPNA